MKDLKLDVAELTVLMTMRDEFKKTACAEAYHSLSGRTGKKIVNSDGTLNKASYYERSMFKRELTIEGGKYFSEGRYGFNLSSTGTLWLQLSVSMWGRFDANGVNRINRKMDTSVNFAKVDEGGVLVSFTEELVTVLRDPIPVHDPEKLLLQISKVRSLAKHYELEFEAIPYEVRDALVYEIKKLTY